MLGYIVRRLLISIPMLIAATFIFFVIVVWAGNPIGALRSQPGISPATIKVREHEYGLDRPVLNRYWDWFTHAIRGDLGTSVHYHEPVTTVLGRAMGVTMRLVLVATIIGVILAIAIGVYAAVRQYSVFDYGSTALAFLFFSMPVFWLASVLSDLAVRINRAVGHRVFFVEGERTPNLSASVFGHFTDRAGHLILPALTLVLVSVAGWSRYQRATMLDVLHADYVRTARAKGLTEFQVIRRHALRNALIPLVTVVALDFSAVLAGAIVTETVFSWNGMGALFIEALDNYDVNLLLGWFLIAATLVVVFNLAADVYYGYLDPRIRSA